MVRPDKLKQAICRGHICTLQRRLVSLSAKDRPPRSFSAYMLTLCASSGIARTQLRPDISTSLSCLQRSQRSRPPRMTRHPAPALAGRAARRTSAHWMMRRQQGETARQGSQPASVCRLLGGMENGG
jgi:hypothetical protein